jgi:hypothetical protein
MGVYKELFNNYEDIKAKYFTSKMSLLELGDQDILYNAPHTKFRDQEQQHYSKWVSIDLHNRAGVTIQDLADTTNSIGQWDIVTNFGTSEHVEPEQGHYNCWVNVHRWTKLQGYSMHDLPETNSWLGHCRFYYDLAFFSSFEKIGYQIIQLTQIPYPEQGNLIFCFMKKVKEVGFFDYETFSKMIIVDTGNNSGVVAPENNPKNLTF